jgi:hypothetical protein
VRSASGAAARPASGAACGGSSMACGARARAASRL